MRRWFLWWCGRLLNVAGGFGGMTEVLRFFMLVLVVCARRNIWSEIIVVAKDAHDYGNATSLGDMSHAHSALVKSSVARCLLPFNFSKEQRFRTTKVIQG